MKKHKFRDRSEDNELMSLQITSMADIFTIILVFLLKSFATSAISLSPQVTLPHVQKDDKKLFIEALMVEILAQGVLVDQEMVVSLKDFRARILPEQSLLGTSETEITPLLKRAFMKKIRAFSSDVKPPYLLTVMADEKTPFAILDEVLKSASGQGFSKVQLVMIKTEG